MNLLFRIVYAAHAAGTHHKLALDALRHLKVMDADLWQNLFLANAKLYLEGSKAPDNEFKDFKNHVLHTRDGYWGGAPEKVRSWYQHLVEALGQQDWHTAVYCAGVLSHYYTDPLMPFHTAQSEAENNIHRAAEWSISKSYDALAALGEREFRRVDVDLPAGANWLATLVCRNADMANANYEKLIAHYDIQRGVVDPPAGLDKVAQRMIAELLRYAAISYGAVLDRAIEESNAHAPDIALTPATLIATAQVPFKLIARKIADGEERKLIERIYDELVTTGTVEKNLPEDDRTVRELHAQEVLASRAPPPQVSKVFPFKPRERVVTRIEQERAVRASEDAAAGWSNVVNLRAAKPVVLEPLPKPAVATAAAPGDARCRAGSTSGGTYAAGGRHGGAGAPGRRGDGIRAPEVRADGAAGARDGAAAAWGAAQRAAPGCRAGRAALPPDARPGRGGRPLDRAEDGGEALPARHQDGARPAEGRPVRAGGAGRRAQHHDGGADRLAGPGAPRVHRAGPAGHARAAAGGRRLSLGRCGRGGRGRQALRRRARLRGIGAGPARAAQRRPARHREDQGLARGRPQRQGGLSSVDSLSPFFFRMGRGLG